MSPPPFATSAISPDGNTVVRVIPGKRRGAKETRDRVLVYSYNVDQDVYQRRGAFDLADLRPPEMLYVSNGGEHLVFVNIGHYAGEEHLGIRVYGSSGKLLKKWLLSDFLAPHQVQGCAKTGSTTQWFEDGRCGEEGFVFWGPARTIKGLAHTSFTIVRYGDKDTAFSFRIDLKTLAIDDH